MSAAFSKTTGLKIVGTHEKLLGMARILTDSFEFKDGRLVDFDYEGYTDVDWDSQKTITNLRGERVFIDEEGNEIAECYLAEAPPEQVIGETAEETKDDERELLIAMVNRLLPIVPEGDTKQAARDLLRSIWN